MIKRSVFILIIFLCLPLLAETFYIAHINDFHGYLYNKKQCNIAKIGHLLKTMQKQYSPMFFLDAGDWISGSVYANYFSGQSIAEAYSMLPLTFTTFGNHEFDYASPVMSDLCKKYSLPVLSSNIDTKLDFPYARHAVLTVGSKKVGFMGLTTEDSAFLSNPNATKNYVFKDIDTVIPKMISTLKANGADFIIALTHLGADRDVEIARRYSEIDLIVGGHSHTATTSPIRVGNTVIVQAGNHGSFLGWVRIDIENEGNMVRGKLLKIKPYISDDPDLLALAQRYRNRLKQELSKPVATLKIAAPVKNVRIGESLIGNLITDSLREQSGADIAFMNAGGIRKGLPLGTVTGEDIYNCLPFSNNALFYRMNRSNLEKMLKHGLNGMVSRQYGRFPIVSGIKYKARITSGKVSIVSVSYKGSEVTDKDSLLMLVPDYVANGGDGYTVFKSLKDEYTGFTGLSLKQIVMDNFRKNGTLEPYKDGRINVQSDSI